MEVIDPKFYKFILFICGCVGIIGLVVIHKASINIFEICFYSLIFFITVFLGFLGAINNKIWIYDDRIEWVCLLKNKNVIYKKNIRCITLKNAIGGYWLITKDDRMFFLFYPFCRNKILKMCNQIKEQYPDFEIR